jgi:hypothetical protein
VADVAPGRDAQLSPAFKEAGTRAYDAVMRVSGVGESQESYEPRRLDAEKALTEAEDKAEDDSDREALKILQAKLRLEGLNRAAFQRLHDVVSLATDPNRELAFHLATQSTLAIDQCSAEATGIFRPGKLEQLEGRRAENARAALAKKGACLSMKREAERMREEASQPPSQKPRRK